jgi:hypothetical protein
LTAAGPCTAGGILCEESGVDLITDIAPNDLIGIKLIAESNRFAIYGCGGDAYLLVQRHAGQPWTGLMVSGDGVFRMSALFAEAARDLYREVATRLSPAERKALCYERRLPDGTVATEKGEMASERRELYQDDLTEERLPSPVVREEIAATLNLDPIDGSEETGQPLTAR